MNQSPDSPNRPEDAWERAKQRSIERAKNERQLRQIQEAIVNKATQALDVDLQILTELNEHAEVEKAAQRLALRHQEHYVAPDFVRIMRTLMYNNNDAEAQASLTALRKRANETGFFIMRYTPAMEMARLQSPQYVITESSGRHWNPQHPHHRTAVPAADCQCWLPEATPQPLKHVEMPDGPDDRVIGRAASYLQNTLSNCGEVMDIATSEVMNSIGLAGAARKAAFHHIQTVINPTRGDYPINFMAASIGELNGITLPDGTVVLLQNVGEMSGVKNERSIIIHTGGRYPAKHAYTLVNRTVPVTMEDGEYNIIVDWHMFFHDLRKSA